MKLRPLTPRNQFAQGSSKKKSVPTRKELEAKAAGLTPQQISILHNELDLFEVASKDWLRAKAILNLLPRYDHKTIKYLFKSGLSSIEITRMDENENIHLDVLQTLTVLDQQDTGTSNTSKKKRVISKEGLREKMELTKREADF